MAMKETSAIKIPFIKSNFIRCICGKCPVQSKSECVKDKMGAVPEILQSHSAPRHEDFPFAYCAAGTATCTDIDVKQTFICFDCAVYKEYKLSEGIPVLYYCKDGIAK
jgi:hypothetical protein